MVIDKPLVKKQFNSGLHTYEQHACVQYKVTTTLVDTLLELGIEHLEKVFEIGCGSGFLTQKLIKNLRIDTLSTNDISCTSQKHMQRIAQHNQRIIDFRCGDAESMPYPTDNNAIFTTSTIQWFSDVSAFFTKVSASLADHGLFAFSTFGTENYKEIRSITGVGLNYYTSDHLTEMLSSKFDILIKEEWKEVLEFDHPIKVLKHMKQTGVNGIKQGCFGKKQLTTFIDRYIQEFSNSANTVSLTYHPIIIIAKRK